MRIENHTAYSTTALRWLARHTITRIERAEGMKLDDWQRANFCVEVNPSRGGLSGHARIKGRRITVALPNPGLTPTEERFIKRRPELAGRFARRAPVSTKDVASIVQHELYHSFGFEDEYRRYGRRRSHGKIGLGDKTGDDYAWAVAKLGETFPLQPAKVKAARAAGDLQRKRYDRVLARIVRWTRIKKRAETALKKLGQQKRYYERQQTVAAASAPQPQSEVGAALDEIDRLAGKAPGTWWRSEETK